MTPAVKAFPFHGPSVPALNAVALATAPPGSVTVESQDAAASDATLYTISVGESFIGSLSEPGDRDWIRIEIGGGQRVTVTLSGNGDNALADPFLQFHSDGVLYSNDDGGEGRAARFTFFNRSAEASTFYIEAAAFADLGAGDYRLDVTPAADLPSGTDAEMADFLTHGYWLAKGDSPHSFDLGTGNDISVNITTLTAEGQKFARWAFQAWEMVANLRFVEVSETARITFSDDDLNSNWADHTSSGTTTLTAHVNVGRNVLDIYGPAVNGLALNTYIHEIGHALGLGHQGAYNNAAKFDFDAAFLRDNWQASIMSYFSQNDPPVGTASWAAPITPMPVDILAIQNLYGRPAGGVTAGDTVWGENGTLPNFLGMFFHNLDDEAVHEATSFAFTIFDEGGQDTLDFGSDTESQYIDLRPGSASGVYGASGNLIILRDTLIEHVIAGSGYGNINGNHLANAIFGGGGRDMIYGHAGDDTLFGGTDDDQLFGGAGDDTLYGGSGRNTLNGGPGSDSYYLQSSDDVVFEAAGWAGTDRVFTAHSFRMFAAHIESLALTGSDDVNGEGNAYGNVIIGNTGNNHLSGLGGDDTLQGGAGDDTLDGGTGADLMQGGPGSDTYHVDNLGDRVQEKAGWAGTDHVLSSVDFRMAGAHVENLTLAGNAHTRGTGNGLDNILIGNAGNNILDGGKGIDTLIGGDGNDIYFTRHRQDVVIEQAGEGTDTIKAFRNELLAGNIENLHLMGSAALNGNGNSGANTIIGNMAGNQLNGRGGIDRLTGQGGADTFVFTSAPGPENHVTITDFTPDADVIWLRGTLFGALPAGALDAGQLHFGTAAADAGDRLIYDRSTGRLWVDADGTGSTQAHLFATLGSRPVIDHGDFWII